MADQDFPFIKTGIALNFAGGMIEGRSSRAVASTPNEAHKAQFQAWTTGGALIADVGAGLIVYGIYKRSPFWGGAVGLGLLALTVMGSKNPEKTLNAMERWGGEPSLPSPVKTGFAHFVGAPGIRKMCFANVDVFGSIQDRTTCYPTKIDANNKSNGYPYPPTLPGGQIPWNGGNGHMITLPPGALTSKPESPATKTGYERFW